VFPTDRYLEQTPWSDVAPAGMMVRPAQYSQYRYSRGAVIPVHSDARVLALPSAFADGVYSAGSIEHFGSLEAVAAAAEEIGRVLKPGGIAVISTEFRLDGPNDRRWFDDGCILFTPELLQDYIVKPSGLELIGEASFDTSQETFDNRVVLFEFLEKAKRVETLTDKRNAYPNLVLYHEGFLFCSVHVALRKAKTGTFAATGRSARFEETVAAEATRTSGILTAQIAQWTSTYGQRPSTMQYPRDLLREEAEAQQKNFNDALADVVRRYEQSRSWRVTAPLRAAARIVRGTPLLRRSARFVLRALRAAKRLAQ
jgi:hypothetical protein